MTSLKAKDIPLDPVDIDLKEIIAILKRQRRLIVVTLAVVLGLAFAYLLTATPIYRATTLVQVDAQGTNLLDPSADNPQQSAILNSRLDSEVEIMRSSSTALAVVQAGDLIQAPDFGPQIGWTEKLGITLGIDLSGDAIRKRLGLGPKSAQSADDLVNATILKLQGAVQIQRQGLTYLIGISLASPDPDRAAELANLYAQTYIESQVATKTSSLLGARDVLRRQITTAQNDLSNSETAVNGFIETNLARLESESGDPAVAALRRQLESAKSDQLAKGVSIASAEGAIGSKDWDTVAQSLGDAALQELARQRNDLQNRLGQAAKGTAEALDLTAQLDVLDKNLATRSQATLDLVQADVKALGTREATARDQLRTTLLQSNLSAEMLTELFDLQQSATIARTQYQTLLSREQDMGTLANLQIADARIVSKALRPATAASPNKRLITALAVVGGLGLGILLGFLKEYYIGGVTSASQLQNILQVRVPVTVPEIDQPETGSPADMVTTAPMSPYAETFRKLRASLDLGMQTTVSARANAGIILVCSALQAEGKTTTAIALARTYALSGARTLLLDADLRKPSVEVRMGCSSEVGLLDYLTSWGTGAALAPLAAQDPLSPLVVLTAGGRSSVPTDQLINSKAFDQLIKGLMAEFDMIVIDSPPLLPVVDTRYLARHADAVVQVVRYISTTQGEVREAATQLQDMMRPDARLYGILSQEERGSRRYGYYGRYGSYYGQDDA